MKGVSGHQALTHSAIPISVSTHGALTPPASTPASLVLSTTHSFLQADDSFFVTPGLLQNANQIPLPHPKVSLLRAAMGVWINPPQRYFNREAIYLFIYYYIFKEQVSFSLKNFLFIYFCLHWVFVAVLSLVAASKNCSPAVTHSLLIAVASLVEEHRL